MEQKRKNIVRISRDLKLIRWFWLNKKLVKLWNKQFCVVESNKIDRWVSWVLTNIVRISRDQIKTFTNGRCKKIVKSQVSSRTSTWEAWNLRDEWFAILTVTTHSWTKAALQNAGDIWMDLYRMDQDQLSMYLCKEMKQYLKVGFSSVYFTREQLPTTVRLRGSRLAPFISEIYKCGSY